MSAPDAGAPRWRSRLKFLAILAAFGLPFVIATLWFWQLKASGGRHGNRANGTLIEPARPLDEFRLAALPGAAVSALADLRGHWSLIYFHDGACAASCQQVLHNSRQVHISLGREMHRLRRLYVGDTALPAALREQHLALQLGGPDQGEGGLRAQVRRHVGAVAFDADPRQLYLVDPLGNLMMRFPGELPQKGLLKDLKVLLKASRIG